MEYIIRVFGEDDIEVKKEDIFTNEIDIFIDIVGDYDCDEFIQIADYGVVECNTLNDLGEKPTIREVLNYVYEQYGVDI